MSVILTLNGVNGQLELYKDKIIIKRKGALAKEEFENIKKKLLNI